MIDASTLSAQLQSIVTRLGVIADSFGERTSYQAKVDQAAREREDTLKKSAEKNDRAESFSIKNFISGMLGMKQTSTLTSTEKQRHENIAKCYDKVFKVTDIRKSLSNILESQQERQEQQDRKSLLSKFVSKKPDQQAAPKVAETKKSWFESIFSGIGGKLLGGAALIALGTGLYYIIKSLVATDAINTKSVLAFVGVIAAVGAALYVINKTSTSLIKAALAFGIVAFTLNKYVVPALKDLANVKWDDVKEGIGAMALTVGTLVLGMKVITGNGGFKSMAAAVIGLGVLYGAIKIMRDELVPALLELTAVKWDDISGGLEAAGVAVVGLGVLVAVAGKLVTSSVSSALAGAAGLAAVWGLSEVLGVLGSSMQSFAGADWSSVDEGLKTAGVALLSLTSLVGIIGTIFGLTGGIAALAAAGGLAAIAGIAWNMGYFAEQLVKFNDVSSEQIKSVGSALTDLGKGFGDFFNGLSIRGAIAQSISNIFGGDLASQLKDLSKIDAERLSTIGKSVSLIAGAASFDEGLESITQIDRTLKSIESTSADKVITRLSKATADIKPVMLEIAGVTEMQRTMQEFGELEVSLLRDQVQLLDKNNKVLSLIADSIQNIGSSRSIDNNLKLNIREETSITRQNYLQSLNVMGAPLR